MRRIWKLRWRWVALTAVILLTGVGIDGCRATGARAKGARLERMQHSPAWKDGHFVNPQPIQNHMVRAMKEMFQASPYASPKPGEIVPRVPSFDAPGELFVTWFGHSSALIEMEGQRLLLDPIWGERASPVSWAGPKRWFSAPIAIDGLGRIDWVLISHDHYDHLDMATVDALRGTSARFVVPLGLGAHLESWGIPAGRIVELDWWESVRSEAMTITLTPSRHASGRIGLDKDATLWGGFAMKGARRSVYYSGDTGLFPAMRDIGEKLGPFDVTLIEVGQYNAAWSDWHIGPEQALLAHRMVRGGVMLPVHWGLFQLSLHGWTEPVERTVAAAKTMGVPLLTPRPGERISPLNQAISERWWPEVPWQTAAEAPIVSSQLE